MRYRDIEGRILLVKPTYKDGWDLPGGYVETSESPRAAAIREVREELGVHWPVRDLLIVDWAPHPDEGDKLLFIFAGQAPARAVLPSPLPTPAELDDARFFELAELHLAVPERLALRLLAISAHEHGIYLEHGIRLDE